MEGSISNPVNIRIAVVTGGNRGIGLEVCRQLSSNGITVVLTAINKGMAVEAVEKLKGQGLSNVLSHELDITNASSVARLADFLKTRFGKLDILVNNAAVSGVEHAQDPVDGSTMSGEKFTGMDRDQRLEWLWRSVRETYDAAKEGLQTNYHGTKRVIEALLNLLLASSDGRIVNLSSDFGQLRFFRNEELKQELNNVEGLTEDRLDELLDMFLKDFDAGTAEVRGWPAGFSAYKVSKAALNAYSRLLATKQPALCVNCVHPGYVKTDLTLQSGLLTPEEGASNVVKVALLPEGGVTGLFFEESMEASFV
ncbi:hypothetical protein PR202_ga19574 [Eleusine coracana subsp. coracana]|uniref:(+)-neomenthol dehydrogenase n=1 Tax=Eleusine coracana subsp. coracana TaxID=191504 RepID=A0AAV5CWG7_ELECO|nr:hypothetical protein PR202_ga19574 [Eleusine coracana subsp. coracana]